MPSYLSISANAAPFPRAVLRGTGQSVTIDLVVEVNGVPATLSGATAKLMSGSTELASYSDGSGIVVIAGQLLLTIPSSDLPSTAVLGEQIWLAWAFAANGKPQRRGERLLVTDEILYGAARVQDVVRMHRALQDPGNYHPDHLEDSDDPGWGYIGEDTWRDLRLDLWEQYPQQSVDLIRSPETLRRVHRERWAAEAFYVMAGDRGQGSHFYAEAQRHERKAAQYWETLRVLVRDASSTEHPDEPSVENQEAEGPAWMHDVNTDGWI